MSASSQHNTVSRILLAGMWAVVLGLAGGAASVAVRYLYLGLQWLFVQRGGIPPTVAAQLPYGRRCITPLLGALCAMVVLWAMRRWSKSEPFREYVEAIRLHDGKIPFSATLWRTLSSAFSVATGASIGREGSMIQFSAAVTSWLAKYAPDAAISAPLQVQCGVGAAVAAAYQAPIAGMFFAVEIAAGRYEWSSMPFLLLASTAGWLVSRTSSDPGPIFAIPATLPLSPMALWGLLLAVAAGLLAPLYHWLLGSLRFTRRWPLALAWSGLAVGLLSVWHPEVWGNADMALMETLGRKPMLTSAICLLAVRLAVTTFCVGSGVIGGVFTPTIFTGAALGLIAGNLLHLSTPVLLAALGMVSFLSAVTHAPLMAAFMVAELTGQWQLIPAFLLCALLSSQIARLLSSHSLYAIATPKPVDDSEGAKQLSFGRAG